MLNNPEVTSATSEISLNHRKDNKNFPSCTTFSTENTTFLTKFYPPPLKMDIYAYYAYSVRRCSHKKEVGSSKNSANVKIALKNLQMVCLPATLVPNFCRHFSSNYQRCLHPKKSQKNRHKKSRFYNPLQKICQKNVTTYISAFTNAQIKKATLRVSAIGFNPILTYILQRQK